MVKQVSVSDAHGHRVYDDDDDDVVN